jgi:hypothetical protein
MSRGGILRKAIFVMAVCLATFPALCQSTSKYQVATITDVKPHELVEGSAGEATSYDISVKVGDTIYVVLYTTPLGDLAPEYAAGREILVLVGKNAITYNDILGRSFQVPIETRRPATDPKQTK